MANYLRSLIILCVLGTLFIWTGVLDKAKAQDKSWWPVKITEFSTGKPNVINYVPLQEKASNKWNIVALFPHMKDKSFLAADYGLVTEAKRQGVKLSIWEAGGYTNLNRQLSQYDDAMAMGANAIIIAIISPAAVNKKIKEGIAKGIRNVSIINPGTGKESPFDAMVNNDIIKMARVATDVVIEHFRDKAKVRAVLLPGPPGAGWTESMANEFSRRVEEKAKGKFEILDVKYGDTGKSVQMKLVEDVLQSYEDVDLLWGNTPMCEVAARIVASLELTEKTKIMATYESEDLIPLIASGQVLGMVSEFNNMIARVGLDVVVRLLENKPHGYGRLLQPYMYGITKKNVESINWELAFSPKDYKPVYKVY